MAKLLIKAKIAKIKTKTYELRLYKQLPFYLCLLIYRLDGTEDKKYISYLMEMTQHFLRVRGYYKKYPLEEKATENILKDGLQKLGYDIDVKEKS